MVLPFAPVISVWCYLFLFLSLYTASYSPYLHHVQLATATFSLFDVHYHFALTADHFAFTLRRRRRHVVAVDDDDVHNTMRQSARRVWDPGIDPGIDFVFNESLSCHRLSASRLEVVDVNTVNVATMTVQALLSMSILTMPRASARRAWDPGIDPGNEMPLAPTASPFNPMASLYPLASHYPFVDQDVALWLRFQCLPRDDNVLLFHYSHPVLSRPTVPNIINNPVQSCRWCLL